MQARRKQNKSLEEEEEDIEDQEYNSEEEDQNYDIQQEDKDQTIANQKKLIQQMRKQFATTIDTMRQQLNELIEESTEIQTEMLDRIKELKAELASLRKTTVKKTETYQSSIPRRSSTNPRTNEVRSSLYDEGPKHPRKLAPQSRQEPIRNRNNRY